MALDLAGSADLAALLVLVARTGTAPAQVTDGSVVCISVVTARARLAGASQVTGRATAGFDLGRSSVSGQVLHGRIHANVTDVRRGHSLAVRRAHQNSFQIGKHDHEVRSGNAARSFDRQPFPFALFQWNTVVLRKIRICISLHFSPDVELVGYPRDCENRRFASIRQLFPTL